MAAADRRRYDASPSRRSRLLSLRTHYVAFTYAFIALAALLMVSGHLFLLTLLLLAGLVYAPRIVDVVTRSRGDAVLFGPLERRDDRPDAP